MSLAPPKAIRAPSSRRWRGAGSCHCTWLSVSKARSTCIDPVQKRLGNASPPRCPPSPLAALYRISSALLFLSPPLPASSLLPVPNSSPHPLPTPLGEHRGMEDAQETPEKRLGNAAGWSMRCMASTTMLTRGWRCLGRRGVRVPAPNHRVVSRGLQLHLLTQVSPMVRPTAAASTVNLHCSCKLTRGRCSLVNALQGPGGDSRRRACYSAAPPSPSLLKQMLKGEGGAAE